MTGQRRTLPEHLADEYTFHVIADQLGGYVIKFPDLPGCMTQLDDLSLVPEYANEIRELWIESAYEDGEEIPPPTYEEEYSGKFNLRIPRSLHRRLAQGAERDGVSLNQYVMMLLERGDSLAAVERRLDRIEAGLAAPVNAPAPDTGEHTGQDDLRRSA